MDLDEVWLLPVNDAVIDRISTCWCQRSPLPAAGYQAAGSCHDYDMIYAVAPKRGGFGWSQTLQNLLFPALAGGRNSPPAAKLEKIRGDIF